MPCCCEEVRPPHPSACGAEGSEETRHVRWAPLTELLRPPRVDHVLKNLEHAVIRPDTEWVREATQTLGQQATPEVLAALSRLHSIADSAHVRGYLEEAHARVRERYGIEAHPGHLGLAVSTGGDGRLSINGPALGQGFEREVPAPRTLPPCCRLIRRKLAFASLRALILGLGGALMGVFVGLLGLPSLAQGGWATYGVSVVVPMVLGLALAGFGISVLRCGACRWWIYRWVSFEADEIYCPVVSVESDELDPGSVEVWCSPYDWMGGLVRRRYTVTFKGPGGVHQTLSLPQRPYVTADADGVARVVVVRSPRAPEAWVMLEECAHLWTSTG